MTTHDSGSSHPRAFTSTRVGLAWLTAIGVDLFLNAGLFAPLFDQAREPALLPDPVSFRRIPIGYGVLAIWVTALAWLLDRMGKVGGTAVVTGALAGMVIGVTGLGGLWTAVDISGGFVLAGVTVAAAQGAAAAAVLVSPRSRRSLIVRVVAAVLILFILGQIVANLTGS